MASSSSSSSSSALRLPTHALPVPEMLSRQLLAAQVIRRFGTADDIFDGDELRRLRRFVYDPTEANRLAVLRDTAADEAAHGEGRNSLAGYCIARQGERGDGNDNGEAEVEVEVEPVFTPGDVGALRWWFRELERAGVSLDGPPAPPQ